jgi:hydrogenase expression/formation protein HypE
LIEPGISVVGAALAAAHVGEVVHAMHDPTEGGLATGLFELVAPAGLGLRVIREHISVFPETETICRTLALDPLKLIASGALLIAVERDGAHSVLTAIQATGVPVVVIGEVRPLREGITIVTNGAVEPLTPLYGTRSREPWNAFRHGRGRRDLKRITIASQARKKIFTFHRFRPLKTLLT